MLDSIANMGGSDKRDVPNIMSYVRTGGSIEDGYLAIKGFDRKYPHAVPLLYNSTEIAQWFGWSSEALLSVFDLGSVKYLQNYKAFANPGPTYQSIGFTNKLDAFNCVYDVCERFMRGEVELGPPLIAVASRPKFMSVDKALEKRRLGKTCGRPVCMEDAHESVLSAQFTLPLLYFFKRNQLNVMLGFNKYGDDPKKMLARLQKFSLWMKGDFTAFDASVPPELIRQAFDVIRVMFGFLERYDTSRGRLETRERWGPLSRLEICLDWLEDNVVESHFVMENGDILKSFGGIPSGTGFTSVAGCIVCAIVLRNAFRLARGDKFAKLSSINVYGDDNLNGLACPDGLKLKDRRKWGIRFLKDVSGVLKNKYGMILSSDATGICSRLHVGYACPRVPGDIANYSSQAIKLWREAESIRLGRPLTFSEKMFVLDEEPAGELTGYNTHRWTYVFQDRPSFLHFYFKRDGRMIRPTWEVKARLVHSENIIKSVAEHRLLLVSALVENFYNAHTRNRLMFYLYDSFWQERLEIDSRKMARASFLYANSNSIHPRGSGDTRFPEYEARDIRAWFRKQHACIHLRYDRRMITFFLWLDRILDKGKKVYKDEYDYGSLAWSLRKGRKSALRGMKEYITKASSDVNKTLKDWRSFLISVSPKFMEMGKRSGPTRLGPHATTRELSDIVVGCTMIVWGMAH